MTPAKVLAFACVFESALLVVAYGLGWIVGIDPLAALSDEYTAVAIGLAGVLPMLLLLWWGLQNPGTAMGRATGEARQFVHQFFSGIGPGGFLLVSLLAGLCEEALFRGLLQVFITGHSSVMIGLIAASVLFGLAHAVSLAYAVAATVIGVYLGAMFIYTGSLTAPVICHAVYDFIALLWLSRLPATPVR